MDLTSLMSSVPLENGASGVDFSNMDEEPKDVSVTEDLVTVPSAAEDDKIMIDADEVPEHQTEAKNAKDDFQMAIEDDKEADLDEGIDLLSLPLSKIKKIFKMDPDYVGASRSAVFATGVATELFIQYFTEHAYMLAKMDKRKKLQYKDFSNAVLSQDTLYFLGDTVPKAQTLSSLINDGLVNLRENTDVDMESKNLELVASKIDITNDNSSAKQPLDNMVSKANAQGNETFKRAGIDDLVSTVSEEELTKNV